jgi:hypothetical protein
MFCNDESRENRYMIALAFECDRDGQVDSGMFERTHVWAETVS